MSIVTEALRKVQEQRIAKTALSDPGIVDPGLIALGAKSPSVKTKRPVSSAYRFIFAAAAALLPLCAVFFLLFLSRTSAAPPLDEPVSQAPEMAETAVGPAAVETVDNEDALPAEAALETAVSKPVPVLSGIMYSVMLPQAVLNGMLVGEGDIVDGFSVISIMPSKVTLLSSGEEFELRLR